MTNNLNFDPNSRNYAIDVSQGLIDGVSAVTFAGNNDAIGSANYETLSNVGGLYKYLLTAQTIDIVSDNLADSGQGGMNPIGAGIRALLMNGLDANWRPISELIIMDGTNPVTTTNSYIRVFGVIAFAVGAAEYAVGTITGTSSGSADTLFNILPQESNAENGIYTVPDGFTGNLQLIVATNGQGDNVVARLKIRPNADQPTAAFFEVSKVKLQANGLAIPIPGFRSIPPKTDIEFDARAVMGNASMFASAVLLLTEIP